MALVLLGRVVTFDEDQPEVPDGAIYIDGDGIIVAVQDRRSDPPSGFDDAPVVRTRSAIYPGLIDLHNHLAYNYRSLWSSAGREEPWDTRDQWPRAHDYRDEITVPSRALGTAAGKAVLKYAEVKAVVGGVTCIQGAPGTTRPYEGWMVRNIDNETFGTKKDNVRQSVIKQNAEGLVKYADNMRDGMVFVYHLAEGTHDRLHKEFDDCRTAGALQAGLISIHATALTAEHYREWHDTAGGGAIVWSPFSNLYLYRDTTDVVAARDAGITVCLGSDWGPSGTKNLLGELKVADIWNREHLAGALSDEELCTMATANGGAALSVAWGDRVGRIESGLLADLLVIINRETCPYRNLITATERHVRLVTIGGRPTYGNRSLMTAADAHKPEPITVAGIRKAISMQNDAIKDADMAWPEVLAAMEAVRADPNGAVERSFRIPRGGEEPVRLILDMPGDDIEVGERGIRDVGPVVIPPIDTLFHDAAYFRALRPGKAPILNGLLDGLRDYW